MRPSLEDDGLVARALGVGKGADGLCTLVGIGCQHVVQAVMAKGFKEPFTARA